MVCDFTKQTTQLIILQKQLRLKKSQMATLFQLILFNMAFAVLLTIQRQKLRDIYVHHHFVRVGADVVIGRGENGLLVGLVTIDGNIDVEGTLTIV